MELWERFSGHARRAVLLAHDETLRARLPRIGTEHLLLGLLRLGKGMAVDILQSLEVDLDWLRGELRPQLERGDAKEPAAEVAFTPEAQKVLQHAYNEGKSMGQTYLGTEHILVGLVRERRGVAYRQLKRCGVGVRKVRQELKRGAAAIEERPKRGKMGLPKLEELGATLARLMRKWHPGPKGRGAKVEDFGRSVAQLARAADLDALVLVISSDGLECCLTTKPLVDLTELLSDVKRLSESEKGHAPEEDEPDE